MNKDKLNGKDIAKAILGGLNIPFFSIGSSIKEILFDSLEKEENKKWMKKIESLLQRLDSDLTEKLKELDTTIQFIILNKIPQIFSNDTKNEINAFIRRTESNTLLDDKENLESEFWKIITSGMESTASETLSSYFNNSLLDIQVNKKQITENIIRSIPISSSLLKLMDESRKLCQERNVPYRTPNLLLLLLQIPNSMAKQALNIIMKNLGQQLFNSLKCYVFEEQLLLEKGNQYIEFDWVEQNYIRLAQSEAFNEKYPVVTEKHLLLGILQSESKTASGIKEKIGNKFHDLLNIIRNETPSINKNISSTPWIRNPI